MAIALFILGFVYVVLCEVLDWHGRLDVIKERWPWAWRVMGDRRARLVFMIVLAGLLIEDIRRHVEIPTPSLVVNIVAPAPPTVSLVPESGKRGDDQRAFPRSLSTKAERQALTTTTGAQPATQPTTPAQPPPATFVPQPMYPNPTPSAHSELGEAIRLLQSIEDAWKYSCGQALWWPNHNYNYQRNQERLQSQQSGRDKPAPNNASDALPQKYRDDIAELLEKADNAVTDQFLALLPKIDHAHSVAIARMQVPCEGEPALSIDDVSDDKSKYGQLVISASAHLTVKQKVDNKYDEHRFQPLLVYLQALDKRLRKCSEY